MIMELVHQQMQKTSKPTISSNDGDIKLDLSSEDLSIIYDMINSNNISTFLQRLDPKLWKGDT
ncbi:hypothetical protein [Oceanobacillus locisalsi]|uniref:Uncharacterized protein n=1 Tax=Oceanobacillus locisalsi TaxID=546107 RepID=A0ABW3NIV2_9BACI